MTEFLVDQGCASSTPESGTFRRALPLTRTPAGRHGCYSLVSTLSNLPAFCHKSILLFYIFMNECICLQFLDPYDGSSEDSDESNLDVGVTSRKTRQQGKSGGGGGCRFLGRRRRFLFHHPASVALREVVKNGTRDPVTEPQQHLPDVQMKCGSDSELCVRDIAPSHSDRDGCRVLTEEPANDPTMHSQTTDIEMHCQSNDSGLNVTIPSTSHLPGPVTSVEGTLSQRLDSSSETSPRPCNLRSIYKRKLGFPEAEVGALGQRKRQCVVDMHDEPKEKDSAPEPCLSRTTV